VGTTERQTLPIPYGHHVYVVSDLSISPSTDETSRPVAEFINLLGDIDDAALVVVAGNLFHPRPSADLAKFIGATFAALPGLRDAISSFSAREGHRFVVLPGSDDLGLRVNTRAQAHLESLGVRVASDLVLQVATADGVRDLAVAAGTCTVDARRADKDDRADADRLEDPLSLPRFVASRVLYRRLGGWVWFPFVAMVLFDLFGAITSIVAHYTHEHLHVHTPHAQSFWGNLLWNLLIIAVVEAVVIGVAGLIVRRRFNRGARMAGATEHCEPLSLTHVDDWSSLVGSPSAGVRGPSSGEPPDRRWPSSTAASAPRPVRRERCSSNDGAVSGCPRSSPRSTVSASSRSRPRARSRSVSTPVRRRDGAIDCSSGSSRAPTSSRRRRASPRQSARGRPGTPSP
jgi:hypothetical protein